MDENIPAPDPRDGGSGSVLDAVRALPENPYRNAMYSTISEGHHGRETPEWGPTNTVLSGGRARTATDAMLGRRSMRWCGTRWRSMTCTPQRA